MHQSIGAKALVFTTPVWVVGEILDIRADPAVLDERGLPDPEKVRPFVYSPEVRRYHALGQYLGDGGRLGRDLA